jgi:hypothetical protein
MPAHFIIPAQDAPALRLRTSPRSALDPIELRDGTFALPVSVVADAAHGEVRALVQAYAPPQNLTRDDFKWSEAQGVAAAAQPGGRPR